MSVDLFVPSNLLLFASRVCDRQSVSHKSVAVTVADVVSEDPTEWSAVDQDDVRRTAQAIVAAIRPDPGMLESWRAERFRQAVKYFERALPGDLVRCYAGALETLHSRPQWCRGAQARTRGGAICTPDDPDAGRWSIDGALMKAAHDAHGYNGGRYVSGQALDFAGSFVTTLPGLWNDRPGRSFDAVRELLSDLHAIVPKFVRLRSMLSHWRP